MIQYSELAQNDIVDICQPFLKSGDWHVDPVTGKITTNKAFIDINSLWVHVNRDTERKCEYWMSLFKLTKIRPERCFNCWKVVIRLSIVADLFKLYDFMKFDIDHHCKCGCDERGYTHGIYAGYFYCNSKKEGLDILLKAREIEFNSKSSITLKRGCTEMELQHKDNWDRSGQEIEELFIKNVYIPGIEYQQPDIVKIHVMRKWLELAGKIGDETVKGFNGGHMLAPELKNYEG